VSDHKQAQERFSPARRGVKSPQGGFGPVKRVCQECGASYEAKRRHQIFCSTTCRKAHWAKDRTINPGYDIRREIGDIKSAVSQIIQHLGLGGE
jgi:endogenous inhibitor of DNA gyrase (YacG/DUF329 family)